MREVGEVPVICFINQHIVPLGVATQCTGLPIFFLQAKKHPPPSTTNLPVRTPVPPPLGYKGHPDRKGFNIHCV